MKLATILFSIFLATTSISATPTHIEDKRSAEAYKPTKHHFCYLPGEPCSKLKRAAEAAAEAMASPDALPEPWTPTKHHFCYRPGEPCSKARRSALALAESIHAAASKALTTVTAYKRAAEADPEAYLPTKHHFCYRPGEPCSKAKREALASAEAEAEAIAKAYTPTKHHFCYRPGEPCSKTKREAEVNATAAAREYCDSMAGPCFAAKRFAAAVADVIAEPAVKPESEGPLEEVRKRCYAAGGACDVHKRALEGLSALVLKV